MSKEVRSGQNVCKFLVMNFIAILLFFITIRIKIPSIGYDLKTIPIDHVVTLLRMIPKFDDIYGPIIIFIGALTPFVTKTWNKTKVSMIFSFINLIAIPIMLIWIFKPSFVPAKFYDENMLPFMYYRITLPVATLLPIASLALPFLLNYGLMDFIGVFFNPLMRPIFKTPGKSAVDISASFVGGCSVGVLITNRTYKEGGYTKKEATIIATGFSTVAISFMVIVSKALGGIADKRYLLMNWGTFFLTSILITAIVTAITARIYPISSKEDVGYKGQVVEKEKKISAKEIIPRAIEEGLTACSKSESFTKCLVNNLKDGMMMLLNVPPVLLSIGFIALLLAEYTPIFNGIAYIFYPFAKLLGYGEEAFTLAKGCAISIADMFLPAGIVGNTSLFTQMTMAVVSIAEVIFFTGSIPCLLTSDMEITIKDILILWIERVILALILASLMVRFLYPLFGIPVFV